MSEWLATGGAVLLTAATLPQVVKLFRTRSARDFAWGFTLLNFAGISLIGLRSYEIQEWAFVAVNSFTATFWLLVFAMKFATGERPWRAATPPLEKAAEA